MSIEKHKKLSRSLDTISDELRLEQYKFVTDRQKYFTELARDTFSSYVKIFTALIAGGIALISAKSTLDLDPELLGRLLYAIVSLVTFLGVVAIGQIGFCLARWIDYRRAEREINPASREIKGWWWVFEGLYCAAVLVSIIAIWMILDQVRGILTKG